MTFSVEPPALNGYAAMLGRARDDVEQCKTYFSQNVADLELTDGGLLNPLYYEHIRVKRKLDEMLNQLVALLGSSRDQLALAAVGGIQASSASIGALSEYPLPGGGYLHPGSA